MPHSFFNNRTSSFWLVIAKIIVPDLPCSIDDAFFVQLCASSTQPFTVRIHGREVTVTCPPTARPGHSVRVQLQDPRIANGSAIDRPAPTRKSESGDVKKSSTKLQTFEVLVPRGVKPGQSFALMAGGQRVLVNCPITAQPGVHSTDWMRMQLNNILRPMYVRLCTHLILTFFC